jgi:hypothetical protein
MEKDRDLYEWIAKIIDTCNQDFHFEAVDNLINLYHERVKDEKKKIELEFLRQEKWNQIHFILK